MRAAIRPAIVLLLALTIITGVIYPLIVTGIAKIVFARKASGSMIMRDGKVIGSELIAQPFDNPKYFWPRPSAANYNALAGSGSNLGLANQALLESVRQRVAALRAADPGNESPVPVDLVTASGSGLDPHISVAAAKYQARRVARARGLAEADVLKIVDDLTEQRTFSILGEPRVNVLRLNLALDKHGRIM